MGHYTNEKKFERCCDSILIGEFSPLTLAAGPGLTDTEKTAAQAKYYSLHFTPNQCQVLQSKLGGSNFDKFNEFKIDKITYKIVIMNARAISMEPNYRAPDGSGQTVAQGGGATQTMSSVQDYVTNTYVFHKRWQNDVESDQDFLDWRKCLVGQKGACTFQNLFRQRGRMFNTAITADRGDNIYINNTTEFTNRISGRPLGWQRNATLGALRLGQAGLIVPGMTRNGWDNTTPNLIPKIRVTARVCSTVRFNANGIDMI